MAAQLNYDYSTQKGVAGGLADISFSNVVTRTNEEDDGKMKYGMAVAVGTSAGKTVKIPVEGTTATQIEGICLRAANTELDMKGKLVVPNNEPLSVIKKGNVWGRLATDCVATYGAIAYVVVSGEDAGCFTNTSGNNTVDIGAKFGNASDENIAVICL